MNTIFFYYLFWLSVLLLFYTYIGFPLLSAIRARHNLWLPQVSNYTPTISIIIAAHNEEMVVKQKLDNIFSLNYPSNRLEVIFASDGSNDRTNSIVKGYKGGKIRFLELPRQGKNMTINSAVAEAKNELLIFTDADTVFDLDAVKFLVAPFNDPQIGGVAGNYIIDGNSEKGGSERDFWNFERSMKKIQSRSGSITSAWGPIYAIRRQLFKFVPRGVTDDYYISVQPLINHLKLYFEPKAIARGPVATSAGAEFKRKIRIITAGLRSVWETRQLLNPFQYGFLAVQIFSHKVLRRFMGLPILVLFLTSLSLSQYDILFLVIALLQIGFHGAAVFGFLLRNTRIGRLRFLRLPFFFDMVYTASLFAIINLLFGLRQDIWVPQHDQEN